jgi:ABC-2 type transport system ATP-binding protein
VIINHGRLVAESPLSELTARVSGAVRVRTPQAGELQARLAAAGIAVEPAGADELLVLGAPSERVGEIAAAGAIVLHELVPQQSSLEDVFLELTAEGAE